MYVASKPTRGFLRHREELHPREAVLVRAVDPYHARLHHRQLFLEQELDEVGGAGPQKAPQAKKHSSRAEVQDRALPTVTELREASPDGVYPVVPAAGDVCHWRCPLLLKPTGRSVRHYRPPIIVSLLDSPDNSKYAGCPRRGGPGRGSRSGRAPRSLATPPWGFRAGPPRGRSPRFPRGFGRGPPSGCERDPSSGGAPRNPGSRDRGEP